MSDYMSDAAADWILLRSSDRGNFQITQLHVQKLLFFFEGWHLALTDSPLFDENVHAWKNGPVLKSIWKRFKNFEADPIPTATVRTNPRNILSNGVQNLFDQILEKYSGENADTLVGITHMEGTPWQTVRKNAGVKRGENSDIVIPKKLIKDHFKTEMKRALKPRSIAFGKHVASEFAALQS